MTDEDLLERAAAAAFKALQVKARSEHGGNTQPLLVVYAVEAFLRRLASSEHAERMVLKGGMLLAANDIRRLTRDADLSTHGVPGDEDNVRQLVTAICAIQPEPHDGVTIDPVTIRTERMREGDEYQGVRCKLVATLGKAQIPFALDLSFGDPKRVTVIQLESVIDQPAVRLRAYPLALNLAEKIVTAMQRRETNTRDRDFADLWSPAERIDSTPPNSASMYRQSPIIAGNRSSRWRKRWHTCQTASNPTRRWSPACPTCRRPRNTGENWSTG